MSNTARFITLTGSILAIGLAGTTSCSDAPADGGGRAGSATTGGAAGTGTTGGAAGTGTTGGAAGTGTTGGAAGTGTTGGAAGTGTTGGAAGTGAGGAAGGGTCPPPADIGDGDPCSFTGMCPAVCGIEELGTRTCGCATTADCDTCMPPDATMYPITMPATACSDIEDTIRDTSCPTEGAACIFGATNRGCVCWEFATPGATTWTCGSHNNWIAL